MFRLVLNFVELGDKKITYVEAGDGAGGVSADELHLDAELAVEVLLLGVEPGAGAPVEVEHGDLLARRVVVRADGAVDLEEDVDGVPDDGVGVVVGGRVEPQVELVLLLAVAAGPHVGVEHHRLPARVAHELHVDLVVVVAVTGRELQ